LNKCLLNEVSHEAGVDSPLHRDAAEAIQDKTQAAVPSGYDQIPFPQRFKVPDFAMFCG
jgi:hypothetical protein